MKYKIILLSCIFLILASSYIVDSKKQFATARITDIAYAPNQPSIIWVDEHGKSEIIKLNSYNLKHLVDRKMDSVNDEILENQKIITQFLNNKSKEGYHLHEMNTSVNGGHYSILVFSR